MELQPLPRHFLPHLPSVIFTRKIDVRCNCTVCISLAYLRVTSGPEAQARKMVCCESQTGQWFEYLWSPSLVLQISTDIEALVDNKDLEIRKTKTGEIQILN
jgi:hypothetical protein